MAAAKAGEWRCLLCGVPVAMVGAFIPTPDFDIGGAAMAVYELCGSCMGSAGHEAGMPPELMRRIDDSLRLLSGRATEASVR